MLQERRNNGLILKGLAHTFHKNKHHISDWWSHPGWNYTVTPGFGCCAWYVPETQPAGLMLNTGNLKAGQIKSKQHPLSRSTMWHWPHQSLLATHGTRVKRLGHKEPAAGPDAHAHSNKATCYALWVASNVTAGWANQFSLSGSPQGPVSTGFLP